MSDTPNEKKFMREKVVKPPIDKRRAAGRILCYVLFAAVFGGVAAVSFVASLPTAKKLLGKEQPVTSAPITIERDQDPSGEPTPVETMAETTGEGIRAEDLKDEVDKIVGDAMEKFPWTTKNLTELNDAFRNIYLESEKSIVTVSAVKNDVDWFDNPIETTGQYAGIIIAVNSSEALILTGQSAVAGADSLRVTFGDGSTAAVELKSQDITSKMAVVSAKISDIEEQTVNWMKAVELGNSYSARGGVDHWGHRPVPAHRGRHPRHRSHPRALYQGAQLVARRCGRQGGHSRPAPCGNGNAGGRAARTGYPPVGWGDAVSRTPMDVEDAILKRLQPLREAPGAKTVEAFQGQPDKDTWARLRRGFPAVLVLYAGSPAFTPSGRRLEERMEFEVYVMDKSYRSAANGQKPEPGHPGTYALLAAARERLLGVPPLPGMGPCLPSAIQGFVLDGASVYRMTVSTIHNIAL